MVGVVVREKEDQHMPGLRRTVLSEDLSLFSMRIVRSEAMLGMYNTRLGETRGSGLFDFVDWVRRVGEAH